MIRAFSETESQSATRPFAELTFEFQRRMLVTCLTQRFLTALYSMLLCCLTLRCPYSTMPDSTLPCSRRAYSTMSFYDASL